MPIYEYVCESCGEECEILQKISDPDPSKCPSCGAASLKKKISAVGFRLQGSGWYETDFKTDNRRNLAGEKDAGKDKDKDQGKGESKSEGGANGKGESSAQGGDTAKSDAKKPAKQAAAAASPTPQSGKASSGSSKTTGATD